MPCAHTALTVVPALPPSSAFMCCPAARRFESGIDVEDEVVIMTTKGEAVAVGVAMMNSAGMASVDHGSVCKIKRVIMERDTYPRRCDAAAALVSYHRPSCQL